MSMSVKNSTTIALGNGQRTNMAAQGVIKAKKEHSLKQTKRSSVNLQPN